MSRVSSLLSPILAKRRGKNPDKKNWHNLHGSSSAVAFYQAASLAKTPILLITSSTPQALRIEQELQSLAKHDHDNNLSICLFPDWETLPYDNFSPHQDILSQRLSTLYQLSRMESGIVIVPEFARNVGEIFWGFQI